VGAKVPKGFLHRAAGHLAFVDLPGTAVNDFVPLCFGVSIHGVIEAGEKLTGQERITAASTDNVGGSMTGRIWSAATSVSSWTGEGVRRRGQSDN
jgi:hypothetical protein